MAKHSYECEWFVAFIASNVLRQLTADLKE
jgi:hypothetical protein